MSVAYVGLDVHKKTISYCVKRGDGELVDRGVVQATRPALEAEVGPFLSPEEDRL